MYCRIWKRKVKKEHNRSFFYLLLTNDRVASVILRFGVFLWTKFYLTHLNGRPEAWLMLFCKQTQFLPKTDRERKAAAYVDCSKVRAGEKLYFTEGEVAKINLRNKQSPLLVDAIFAHWGTIPRVLGYCGWFRQGLCPQRGRAGTVHKTCSEIQNTLTSVVAIPHIFLRSYKRAKLSECTKLVSCTVHI